MPYRSVPAYTIMSRHLTFAPFDIVRRWFLESIYSRLRTIFPDEDGLENKTESLVRIGVSAEI